MNLTPVVQERYGITRHAVLGPGGEIEETARYWDVQQPTNQTHITNLVSDVFTTRPTRRGCWRTTSMIPI